ncbi:MAG: hypothetical protein GDA44_05880 [Prochloron sp. SP5CPC1]|nr:hypothetical protein [Candidatus Paraprochloron terpiosi SP5CPC1]
MLTITKLIDKIAGLKTIPPYLAHQIEMAMWSQEELDQSSRKALEKLLVWLENDTVTVR